MLYAYIKEKEGLVKSSVNDIYNKQTFLIDAVSMNAVEIGELSKATLIDKDDITEYMDKEERPKALSLEHHSLIVFSTVSRQDTSPFTPVAIFFNDTQVIVVRSGEIPALTRLLDREKHDKIMTSPSMFVFSLLDEILKDSFTFLDTIEEDVSKIEQNLINKGNNASLTRMLNTRKYLIFAHKTLTANREVIGAIEREQLTHIPKKDIKKYRILYQDIMQMIDDEEMLRDLLKSATEIHMSKESNDLNQAMKKLTVWASYILVPTLITGLYGMNFDHMPELHWLLGYPFALTLMVFSIVFVRTVFKRQGWI